jgi:prevent-host-death family protein
MTMSVEERETIMTSINATKARADLYRLLEEVSETHVPIQIKGKKGSAVLVSEEDWRSIQETLHLLSVPGMRESIIEGMKTSAEDCAEEPGW